MSTATPNIGLVKQAGTEYGDYEITNENWDKIDEEIGKRGKTINGKSADENGDYKVDEVEFARQILTNDKQQGSGTFLARATGGRASLSDGDAKLISVSGRMTHTGIVPESITLTVNAVQREEGEDTITAKIDRDTFVAYVSASTTITLVYTNAWSANPTLYGVTVTGTPINGDQIVIVYVKAERGTITPSNPSRFISTGWNLYNHTNGYAKVVKYSEIYGFLIGGTYTKLEFSTSLTGTKITITPVSGYFEIPSDGYLFVTGGNNTNTYILMTWSNWDEGYDGSWQAYTESVIDFSSIMSNTFPYGLLQVGGVADEISFDKQKTYSRIQRITYSDQAAADAAASGRVWDADENYIYIAREAEQEYSFSATISGEFTASDHGMELIDGGTVPVYVQTIYGLNLVDYIRHDVPDELSSHAQDIGKLKDECVYYGTCSTSATTRDKVVSCANFPSALKAGQKLSVKFTYGDESTSSARLNVNNLGKKNIYVYATAIESGIWRAGEVIDFLYDGSQWMVIGGGVYPRFDSITAKIGTVPSDSTLQGEIDINSEAIAKVDAGLAIIVSGDSCSQAVPVGGYAYIKNNTHGLAEGLYENKSSSSFPTSGGTANSTVFEAVSEGIANALNGKITNPGLYSMIALSSNTSQETKNTTNARKFNSPGVFVVGSIFSAGRAIASTIVPLSDFRLGEDNFVRYVTDDNIKITFHFKYVSDTQAAVYITNSSFSGVVQMYATNNNIT